MSIVVVPFFTVTVSPVLLRLREPVVEATALGVPAGIPEAEANTTMALPAPSVVPEAKVCFTPLASAIVSGAKRHHLPLPEVTAFDSVTGQGVRALIVDKQEQANLLRQLKVSAEWLRVYEDDQAMVLRRKPATAAAPVAQNDCGAGKH